MKEPQTVPGKLQNYSRDNRRQQPLSSPLLFTATLRVATSDMTSCVILNKSVNISDSQFPHIYNSYKELT